MPERGYDLGPADLSELAPLWTALEQRDRELEACDESYRADRYGLTDRRLDEGCENGDALYINAFSHIVAARECHRAFADSIAQRIRPTAVWTMLRPSFELAFYAAWVLDPDHRFYRRQRSLQIRWKQHQGHRERARLLGEMVDLSGISVPPEVQTGRTQEWEKIEHRGRGLLAEGSALQMKRDDVKARINVDAGIRELGCLKRVHPLAPLWASLMWRELSAVSHGDSSVMSALADLEPVATIPGGHRIKMSVRDDSLKSACRSAVLMQHVAMQIYIDRSTRLSQP